MTLVSAKSVLDREIAGLTELRKGLDGKFVSAVDLLFSVEGRILVTGMGKSGHIARKIAATLSSTGSPAFYVHPTEASHGDLGMITGQDGVIALSNSGETIELSDIVSYTNRNHIPLVAITGSPSSTLGMSADVTLSLPEIPEANPVGAPTTSTTAMLVLGDALAVALMERRGFTIADFKVLHPGGALGNR